MELSEVLALVPQQAPFRFIDRIVELDENRIVGSYRFKTDEFFYLGHFPKNPVTPGVILIETMAQTGVVALGLYLTSLSLPAAEVKSWTTFFTDCQIEFFKPVYPGESVIVKAEKIYWRKMKLKSSVKMFSESGDLIAEGTLSGVGVKNA